MSTKKGDKEQQGANMMNIMMKRTKQYSSSARGVIGFAMINDMLEV